MAFIKVSIVVFLTAVAIRVVHNFLRIRRHRAEALRRGCGAIPVVPSRDPLGLSRLYQLLKEKNEHRALPAFAALFDQAGADVHTVDDKFIGRSLIWTRDPENMRVMLTTQFQDFDIGSARQGNLSSIVGKGVFTTTGEEWRHSRAIIRPQFARELVADLDVEERHLRALWLALEDGKDGWTNKVTLQPLLFNLTLDTSTDFLYGESVNSLSNYNSTTSDARKPDPQAFHHHLDEAGEAGGIRSYLGRWYWIYNPGSFRSHCKGIRDYVDWYVEAAFQRKAVHNGEIKQEGKTRFVLLDRLVQTIESKKEVRDHSLNVLTAGRSTTATLLGWTFYHLARDSEVYDKLRNVVLSEFGTFENPKNLTFEDLKGCRYLHCCLNEAFRITPIIALNVREAIVDTTLPNGGGVDGKAPIFIPKGTEVVFSNYALGVRTDIWGDDAKVFKPERFEGHKFSWAHTPFGGGPRVCMGREYHLSIPSVL